MLSLLFAALLLALVALRQVHLRLGEAEARFRAVLDTAQEGIVLRDRAGRIVAANGQSAEIMGMSLDQLRGRVSLDPSWQAVREDGRPLPPEEWPAMVALREGRPQRDCSVGVRMPWGETAWLCVSAVPLFRPGADRPHSVVSAFSDITVRKRREDRNRRQVECATQAAQALAEANARLTEAALLDGLTGLRNRRAFDEGLTAATEIGRIEGRSLSLVLLDVDEFKAYNDRFGHPEGDEALRTVAEAIASVVRAGDLAARYGGEEFALLLPDTDAAGALAVAERLRRTVEATPWRLRPVTVSLGVATGRDGDAERLVAEADAALYRAKAAGRNRVLLANSARALA